MADRIELINEKIDEKIDYPCFFQVERAHVYAEPFYFADFFVVKIRHVRRNYSVFVLHFMSVYLIAKRTRHFLGFNFFFYFGDLETFKCCI